MDFFGDTSVPSASESMEGKFEQPANRIYGVYLAGHFLDAPEIAHLSERALMQYLYEVALGDAGFISYLARLLKSYPEHRLVLLLEGLEFSYEQLAMLLKLQLEGAGMFEAYVETICNAVSFLKCTNDPLANRVLIEKELTRRNPHRLIQLQRIEEVSKANDPGRVFLQFEGLPEENYAEETVVPGLHTIYEQALKLLRAEGFDEAKMVWAVHIVNFANFTTVRESRVVSRLKDISELVGEKTISIAWFGDGHLGIYHKLKEEASSREGISAFYTSGEYFLKKADKLTHDPFSRGVFAVFEGGARALADNEDLLDALFAGFLMHHELQKIVGYKEADTVIWEILNEVNMGEVKQEIAKRRREVANILEQILLQQLKKRGYIA